MIVFAFRQWVGYNWAVAHLRFFFWDIVSQKE
jgi:hypothetical protein